MFRRTVLRLVNAVRRRPFTSLVVMALLGVALAVTAIAASQQSGDPITAISVVRETNSHFTQSGTFVNLPGATTTITVPSGQRALIVARFTAESSCFSFTDAGCEGQVRILIGGVEAAPACGADCAFDSTDRWASRTNWRATPSSALAVA